MGNRKLRLSTISSQLLICSDLLASCHALRLKEVWIRNWCYLLNCIVACTIPNKKEHCDLGIIKKPFLASKCIHMPVCSAKNTHPFCFDSLVILDSMQVFGENFRSNKDRKVIYSFWMFDAPHVHYSGNDCEKYWLYFPLVKTY